MLVFYCSYSSLHVRWSSSFCDTKRRLAHWRHCVMRYTNRLLLLLLQSLSMNRTEHQIVNNSSSNFLSGVMPIDLPLSAGICRRFMRYIFCLIHFSKPALCTSCVDLQTTNQYWIWKIKWTCVTIFDFCSLFGSFSVPCYLSLSIFDACA